MIIDMNEENLISSARQGDKTAITELLMEHRSIVASVVSRLIYEPENRKDVVQNIFIRAIKGISQFNGNCRFSTWIYRLAVNESVDYNRKKLQLKKLADAILSEDFPAKPGVADGYELVCHKEIIRLIGEALQKLSLDQKAAFNLFYICGHSGKESADIMKISEDNYFKKLKAARDRVRRFLIKEGICYGQ